VTSVLNMIGKQSSKYANAGASLAVLFYFTKTITSYTFDEELQGMDELYKNAIFGGVTGMIYKSTRGLYPALFAGALAAIGGGAIYALRQRKKKKSKSVPKSRM